MTLITFQDGKPVMKDDGTIGTEQACCCAGAGECPDEIVIDGFIGPFAPAQWARTQISGSSATFQNGDTELRIARNANINSGVASASIDVDSLFGHELLQVPEECCVTRIEYSYDWEWSTSNGTNNNFDFESLPAPGVKFNTADPANGTYASGPINGPQPFNFALGFQVGRVNQQAGVGTAIISNFQFTAYYEPCALP